MSVVDASEILAEKPKEVVEFPALVAKVTTMGDGSLRVIFDMPEQAVLAAAELMAMKANNCYLTVRCTIREED